MAENENGTFFDFFRLSEKRENGAIRVFFSPKRKAKNFFQTVRFALFHPIFSNRKTIKTILNGTVRDFLHYLKIMILSCNDTLNG